MTAVRVAAKWVAWLVFWVIVLAIFRATLGEWAALSGGLAAVLTGQILFDRGGHQ